MKNKSFLAILLSISIWTSSCTKEVVTISSPDINGQWLNTEVYQKGTNGQFEWSNASRSPVTNNFSVDGRFDSFSDVPLGSGTYQYERSNSKLILHYEANSYRQAGSTEQRVEVLTATSLETTLFDANGNLLMKSRFQRID